MVKKIILVVLTILILVYTYKHYTVDNKVENKVESTQQTEFIPETMDLEMQMEEECLE